MSCPGRRDVAVKVAGPPRRTALWARADCGRAAGQSKRRYRPWFTVCDGLPGGPLASWCSPAFEASRGWRRADRDGFGSASSADRGGVDRHGHRRGLARPDRAGDRAAVRAFFEPFRGAGLEVALEATTGWRFVVEELQRVNAEVHLAEAAEASALKGKKRRAKTDFADARHLRELLLIGRIPESWIPPAHILDLRARVRTRHLLSNQRTEWQQRMHAVLYHHGVPQRRDLLNHASREWLAEVELPDAAREQIEIALHVINAIEQRLVPFDRELNQIAKSQPGCRTLMHEIYGIGALTSVTILAELGDVRRFQNSRDVVRYGGMDITVYQSDAHRAPGHLSRQGPPALRWALYEAAQRARFPASPDRAYYEQLAARIGGNRACLALARKLLKRCYHLLKGLGDQALAPVA